MPVSDQIEGAGKAIKAIGAVIALFPGMAYLVGIVELPASMVTTVTIVAFSVSTVVLIAVFLLGDWIRLLSKRRAIIYSVSAVILGGLIVIAYSEFAQSHVVTIPPSAGSPKISFVTPVAPSDAFLESMGTGHPTKANYEDAYFAAADIPIFREDLHRESLWTRLIMYLLLLLSQILLIAPVVAAAWKLADTMAAKVPPGAAPAPAQP